MAGSERLACGAIPGPWPPCEGGRIERSGAAARRVENRKGTRDWGRARAIGIFLRFFQSRGGSRDGRAIEKRSARLRTESVQLGIAGYWKGGVRNPDDAPLGAAVNGGRERRTPGRGIDPIDH